MKEEDNLVALSQFSRTKYSINSFRRKSCVYRPTNFYPPDAGTAGTSRRMAINFESLPMMLLNEICSKLCTRELLNLCVSSKYLYLPAALHLYKTIILSDNKALINSVKSATTMAPITTCTLIHIFKLPLLLKVICNNEKIASFIKTLVFLEKSYLATLEDKSINNSLMFTLLQIKLNDLIIPHFPTAKLQELYWHESFKSIQKIVITLNDCNLEYIHLPNLTHLKILYSNKENNELILENLTTKLLGSFKNLITLDFEELQDDLLLNSLNRHNSNTSTAIYFIFFKILQRYSRKLQLQHLGMDGYIGSDGYKISVLLSDVLDLTYLKDLQLNVKEKSHSNEAHYNCQTTLLYNLTKLTPNLKKLAVHPTHDCLFCQFESLVSSLRENIPNSLNTFSAVYEFPNSKYARLFNEAIGNHQKSLSQLRLINRGLESFDRMGLEKWVGSKQFSNYEHAIFYESQIKSVCLSDCFLKDLRLEIISNNFMSTFIRDCFDALSEYLKLLLCGIRKNDSGYLGIFSDLPDLKLASIFNITLTMKDGKAMFQINGEYVPLVGQ